MHEVFYKIDLYDNQNLNYFSMKPGAYFDDIANCSSQLINLRNCQIDMKIVVTLQNLSKPISLNAYFEYVKRIWKFGSIWLYSHISWYWDVTKLQQTNIGFGGTIIKLSDKGRQIFINQIPLASRP